MKVPHYREYREHLLRGSRSPPPVLSAEGDLGNLLSRAKAIVYGATSKALLSEACVDVASEVRLQMRTSLPGVFIDREVDRGREGWHDTAQCEAVLAVSL